jgi:hypothetical protein
MPHISMPTLRRLDIVFSAVSAAYEVHRRLHVLVVDEGESESLA